MGVGFRKSDQTCFFYDTIPAFTDNDANSNHMIACTDADKTWSECTSLFNLHGPKWKDADGHVGVMLKVSHLRQRTLACRTEARNRGYMGVGFRKSDQTCFFYDTIPAFTDNDANSNHMIACTDADKTWSECTTCSSCT